MVRLRAGWDTPSSAAACPRCWVLAIVRKYVIAPSYRSNGAEERHRECGHRYCRPMHRHAFQPTFRPLADLSPSALSTSTLTCLGAISFGIVAVSSRTPFLSSIQLFGGRRHDSRQTILSSVRPSRGGAIELSFLHIIFGSDYRESSHSENAAAAPRLCQVSCLRGALQRVQALCALSVFRNVRCLTRVIRLGSFRRQLMAAPVARSRDQPEAIENSRIAVVFNVSRLGAMSFSRALAAGSFITQWRDARATISVWQSRA
jgi:hypothetical protein